MMFQNTPTYLWWCFGAFAVWAILVFTGLDDLIPDIPFIPIRTILLAAGIFGGIGVLLYAGLGVISLYIAAVVALCIALPIGIMTAKVKADSKDIQPKSIVGTRGTIVKLLSKREYLIQLGSEAISRIGTPASNNLDEVFETGEEVIITGYSGSDRKLQFVSVAEI